MVNEGLVNAKFLVSSEGNRGIFKDMLEQNQQGGSFVFGSLLDLTEDPAKEFAEIVVLLQELKNGLNPGTVLVVHGGRGPLKVLLELQEKRKNRDDDMLIAQEALRI